MPPQERALFTHGPESVKIVGLNGFYNRVRESKGVREAGGVRTEEDVDERKNYCPLCRSLVVKYCIVSLVLAGVTVLGNVPAIDGIRHRRPVQHAISETRLEANNASIQIGSYLVLQTPILVVRVGTAAGLNPSAHALLKVKEIGNRKVSTRGRHKERMENIALRFWKVNIVYKGLYSQNGSKGTSKLGEGRGGIHSCGVGNITLPTTGQNYAALIHRAAAQIVAFTIARLPHVPIIAKLIIDGWRTHRMLLFAQTLSVNLRRFVHFLQRQRHKNGCREIRG